MLHNDQLQTILSSYPQFETVHANVQDEIDREELDQQTNNVSSPAYFTHFPTNQEVITWVNDQIAKNPGLAQSVPIGTSFQNRPINGIRIGRNPSAPIVYIHCTIHAREWITTTTCCLIIEDLLGKDVALADAYTFIIVPIFNPDGYEYSHRTDRMWRKNRQTNSGSTCIGTDLNRNYRVGWGGTGSSGDPCSDIYRGTAAFTAPETDAEENYLVNLQNVISYVDIHSYGSYFMSPWGYTTALPTDYNEMYRLMELASDAITATNGYSYEIGTSARVIYVAAGGSDDWAYGTTDRQKIIPSYTVEARGTSFIAPTSMIVPVGTEIWNGCKAMIQGIRLD